MTVHDDGAVDAHRQVGGGFAPSAYDDGTLAEMPGVRFDFVRQYTADEVADAFTRWASVMAGNG